jgi:hypothetical protein
MDESKLNLGGLNDQCVRDVVGSFEVMNRNVGAELIVDENEVTALFAKLSGSNINVFYKNFDVLNLFKVGATYLIQLKAHPFEFLRYRTENPELADPERSNYILSQLGFKPIETDYSNIRIEPIDPGTNSFALKLLHHIFTSDDVFIHGHELFNSKYRVYATDKQQANTLLSDGVLDTISKYNDMHISIGQNRVAVYSPELDAASTMAIMDIFGVLSL